MTVDKVKEELNKKYGVNDDIKEKIEIGKRINKHLYDYIMSFYKIENR